MLGGLGTSSLEKQPKQANILLKGFRKLALFDVKSVYLPNFGVVLFAFALPCTDSLRVGLP